MTFEYWKARNGQWYWHFKAGNGKIIADGGEGYSSKYNVLRAIENFKGNTGSASVINLTPLAG